MACRCFSSRSYLSLSSKGLFRCRQYFIKTSQVNKLTWQCNFFSQGSSASLSITPSNRSHSTRQSSSSTISFTDTSASNKNIFLSERCFSSQVSENISKEIANQRLYEQEKTKITIINENIDGKARYPYVFKYSNRGFVIGSNQVFGSAALVKGCVFSWKVFSHHQITPESLSLFTTIHPKLEVLILGLGDRVAKLQPEVLEFLRKENIPVEILDTPNACATYNFLTEEGRITAAGLIPPQKINLPY